MDVSFQLLLVFVIYNEKENAAILRLGRVERPPWLSSSLGLNTPAWCIKRPYKQIETPSADTNLERWHCFLFHWSTFKSVRPAPTRIFRTSSAQYDIWGMILTLCMTAPLHLSHLWFRYTDLCTKATRTRARWVQLLLKAYGINTFSCRQILLHRWNMFSVSSSDKLSALQRMLPMPVCWHQICKTQYRFRKAEVCSSADIKIWPIKYAECDKVIVSPWWWCWGQSIEHERVMWLTQ